MALSKTIFTDTSFNLKHLLIAVVALSFVACSPVHRGPNSGRRSGGSSSPGSLTASAAAFEGTLYPELQSRCATCHGAGQFPEFAVSDVQLGHNALVDFNLVDLQSPENSRIVIKLTEGHNGFVQADIDALLAGIQDWAAAAGGSNGIINTALVPTYESINNRIFIARCNNCHNANNAQGGLDLTSRDTAILGFDNVTPENTPLYQRIILQPNQQGFMPAGSATPLTQEETDTILAWIQLGGPLN